ncbi:30S ribosomal protein S7 [bacterium]|nr:MAG: 30S ribosomal protein S7 [bacterium]
MPRRRRPEKREVIPDYKYNSELVARFINCIMKCGKRSTAQRLVYTAFDIIKERTGQEGIDVFEKAIENVRPQLAVKPRRVGGATYQVPVEVPEARQVALAIRWIIQCAKARGDHGMAQKLANEFIAASENEGGAIKKKIDTHKMAKANRAFAHYRW